MAIYNRKYGEEQPYFPLGPFKIRLPFIHYKWEMAETIQSLALVVVAISMIPILEQNLGLPYEVALAYTIIHGIVNMFPALLGVAFVPGWITAALPLVLIYLGDFEPGPQAIQAMVALQIILFLIFFLLGITKLGGKLVKAVPNSLKGGILIGAGIAAVLGEIEQGGRVMDTPISLIIAGLVTFYTMFSLSFRRLREKSKFATMLSNYGMVPGLIVGIIVAWIVKEYPLPNLEWGIVSPAFAEMWQYTPFVIGFPSFDVFMLAIPTALIAYIIAYGDIVVGDTLLERSNELRKDEDIDNNIDRVHLVTALRNGIHALVAPYPGLAGPIWTAVTATVSERYTFGRKAMDSIFGGIGTFHIVNFIALFLLPLVTFFQPVLPIALSVSLLVTGYICIQIGLEQVNTPAEQGVAGITAVVLAIHGAAYGLITGLVLYVLIVKNKKKENISKSDDTIVENQQKHG
ncbi:solute carrier family 23 protein [Oceanobacillus rekensis]|uniref:solute carrier family 23 protein n=1 Tax=Oceanobacillus rekensis TaxID=937927 RepID=UPI000B444D2D|nr:solute carrier family 23 protein [Oceanobacillus rekensis]